MAEGRVRVNGEVVKTLGARVDPARDTVEVDGRRVTVGRERWIMLNKPPGTLTTRHDPGGRPTVYSLLPREDRELVYLGRLDQDTQGLLLFTNDGDSVNRLLHPSGETEREYLAEVVGVPDDKALRQLERGVALEDGLAKARVAEVTARMPRSARVRLVLLEGRKREVRRMLEAVGHPVRALMRVRFGPIRLTGLATGDWRELTRSEISSLKGGRADRKGGRGQSRSSGSRDRPKKEGDPGKAPRTRRGPPGKDRTPRTDGKGSSGPPSSRGPRGRRS